MLKFKCPHCQQSSITFKQMWLAGKWVDVICANCGGRSCVYPALLVVIYFFYTWDVVLFGYLTVYNESVLYLGIMFGGWVVLELFSLTLPLVRMKSKSPAPDSGNTR